MAESDDGDVIHPIIDRPHEYEIVRLDYHNDPDNFRNSFLDLTLRYRSIIRRLRFLRPQRLVIGEGFPTSTHGMTVLDISGRHWDDIRVEVGNFEASPGAVTFYASDVIDLDSQA